MWTSHMVTPPPPTSSTGAEMPASFWISRSAIRHKAVVLPTPIFPTNAILHSDFQTRDAALSSSVRNSSTRLANTGFRLGSSARQLMRWSACSASQRSGSFGCSNGGLGIWCHSRLALSWRSMASSVPIASRMAFNSSGFTRRSPDSTREQKDLLKRCSVTRWSLPLGRSSDLETLIDSSQVRGFSCFRSFKAIRRKIASCGEPEPGGGSYYLPGRLHSTPSAGNF